MKKLSLALVMLLCVSILFTACNSNPDVNEDDPPPSPPVGEKVTLLKVGLPGDTGGYDPATGTTDTPQQVIKACYRGLFSVEADGTLRNEICTDYSIDASGLIYTINLRKDAKWSDGKIVTAHDFVFGWRRNLVPELKAAYADLFNAVANFEECMAGEKPLEEFGVKALDDFTLEVTLSRTQPYFIQQTTFSPFYPVREDKVSLKSSDWSIQNVQDVVCNGPFKFDSYMQNEKIVIVPNPESYQKNEVALEKIEFYFIPDQQTSVSAFKSGEVDMAYSVPTDINETYDNANEVVRVPYLVNNIMSFSGRFEPFQDIRVRKAFNIAINREQICQIVGGASIPLYALIPPGVTNPATGKDFREEGGDILVEDVALAQRLMEEAGYPGGSGFPEITYLYSNSAMHQDVAQAIQGMIKENLGVEITLKGMEAQAFAADRRAGKFDIGRFGTSADYNDPMTWLALYDSSTAYIQKLTGYQTPEYDSLIKASDAELEPAKRFQMLHDAEKMMVEEYWWLPVSTYDKQILVKEYVKGFYTSTAGDIFIYAATIDK